MEDSSLISFPSLDITLEGDHTIPCKKIKILYFFFFSLEKSSAQKKCNISLFPSSSMLLNIILKGNSQNIFWFCSNDIKEILEAF